MPRICLVSDTHLGITSKKKLDQFFHKLTEESFDILIHAGDYSGSYDGHRMLAQTVALMRKHHPTVPIVSTIGNHDFWCRPFETIEWSTQTPTLESYTKNYNKVKAAFKKHHVHFIDEDGLFRFQDIVICGASGWYQTSTPRTNDINFLPSKLGGHTHSYLLKRSYDIIDEQLKDFKKEPNETFLFLSHFPVVNKGNDYKGAFNEFSWSESIHKLMEENYNCKHFLEGHSHQRREGEPSYNCGSDYYWPKFIILNV